MTDLAVQKSLLAVTRLKTRNGETAEEFTRRVWQKCQALEDEAWQSLGEPAQAWVNDYTVKNENKAPLPVLALPEIEVQAAAKEQAQVVKQDQGLAFPTFLDRNKNKTNSKVEVPEIVAQEQEVFEEPEQDQDQDEVTMTGSEALKQAVDDLAAKKKNGIAKIVAKKQEKEVKAKKIEEKKAVEGKRGRAPSALPEDTITLLVDHSPYREGCISDKIFKKYKTGMTVQEAQDAGVPYKSITWDRRHGYIKVGAAFAQKPLPTMKSGKTQEKAAKPQSVKIEVAPDLKSTQIEILLTIDAKGAIHVQAKKVGDAGHQDAAVVKEKRTQTTKAKSPSESVSKGRRGRPSAAPMEAGIKLLIKESPYREGCLSDKAFRVYRDGMTVKEALSSKVVSLRGIIMDRRKGYIELVGEAA